MKGKKFIAIISIVCILSVMLCIPAFATVTESDGDGYALYNGMYLPNIDSVWDKNEFSYAFISPDSRFTNLFLSSVPIVYKHGENVDSVRASSVPFSYQQYSLINGEFVLQYSAENVNDPVLYFDPYWYDPALYTVWSNHDIFVVDEGTLLIAASDPIPLDGYNIIEWDGDTSGLVEATEYFYKLAPYEYAIDALAVIKTDILSVQTSYVTESPFWGIMYNVVPDAPNGSPIVVASNDAPIDGLVIDGIAALRTPNAYVSLIAYRTVEEPPGEGGDEPDDPQPPFGAAEMYLKLHLLALTLQQK